jgi:hypothetical protein
LHLFKGSVDGPAPPSLRHEDGRQREWGEIETCRQALDDAVKNDDFMLAKELKRRRDLLESLARGAHAPSAVELGKMQPVSMGWRGNRTDTFVDHDVILM